MMIGLNYTMMRYSVTVGCLLCAYIILICQVQNATWQNVFQTQEGMNSQTEAMTTWIEKEKTTQTAQ